MAARKKNDKQTKTRQPKTKKADSKPGRAPKAAPTPRKDGKPSHIVGVGASAGGLEAFEQFFGKMSPDSGMAFILVPHLDPTHISIMPSLIQKSSKMAVVQVKDGAAVQPNTVYIIPPNSHMAILNGTLQLIEPLEAKGPRMSIDYFFRSLAEDQGEQAIGIILSGMGTDGTLGLRAVKGELGMAMVQDPDSAKYDSMPRSALEAGVVDYTLPPEEMPGQLISYAEHSAHGRASRVPVREGSTPDLLQKVFILLRSHTGHDFSLYKQTTIRRRIERRMNVHQLNDLAEYVRYLQHNVGEVEILFKELLINVTNFFRDPEAFEVLRQKVLPDLLKNKSDDSTLRVWVPGCSSGEEVYSLAIIISKCMDEINKRLQVQIFATDIDEDAIRAARAAEYPESISADVHPDDLKRFFTRENNLYRIKKQIRETLIFAPQNLIKDPPFTKLDLLCCRNLLIYLESELQKRLLPLFHYSLAPGGILFLGSSESIGGFVDLFSAVDRKWKVFKRKGSASSIRPMVQYPMAPMADGGPEIDAKRPGAPDIAQVAERILLERYTPPCVIINNKGDITYVHGRTGNYLEPAPGLASLNLFEMAREGLKLHLAAAVRKATTENQEITHEGLQVKDDSGFRLVNLTVRPMAQPAGTQGEMMVVFEEVAPPKEEKAVKKKSAREREPDKRSDELEQELRYTKEYLQSTIEELETSNEELKSTNEELQSTNEELQSANEELETSKEEQQSLNEELVTVNAELQGNIEELTAINNDMINLLNSNDVPTIFLDNDLCVKRFTANATRVINLIQSDVGRPIGDIASKLKHNTLIDDAQEVLNTLIHCENEVQTEDGHWHLLRILPYRTVENVIDGVVATFFNIHEQKLFAEEVQKLNQEIQAARKYAESIVDTVREPIVVLDADLKVVSANASFFRTFQVTSKQTTGQLIYTLGNRQWDIPRLKTLLEEIVPKNTIFEGFEVEHEFQHIGHRKMVLNARQILPEEMGTELILLTIEDVTEQGPPGVNQQRE